MSKPNYYLYTFRKAVEYINRFPQYWFWVGVRVIYIASEVAAPILFGQVINILSRGDINSLEQAAPWIISYLVIAIAFPIVEVSSGIKAWYLATKSSYEFMFDIVAKLRSASLSYWQEKNRGQVMKILESAVRSMNQLMGKISHQYLWIGGRVAGMLMSSVFLDPFVVVVYLVNIILFFLNIRILIPREKARGLEAHKKDEKVSSTVFEYLNNFKTIVYLNLFDRQERRVAENAAGALEKKRQVFLLGGIKWFNNNQLNRISLAAIFVYGIYRVMQGDMAVGTLTTLIIFGQNIAGNLGSVVTIMSDLIDYVNSMQRYHEVVESIPETASGTAEAPDEFQRLEFNQVSLSREERETLSDISFSLEREDRVAIVGPTGAGKSSMMDILLMAETRYDGRVFLNQREYQDLSVNDVAGVISIVPQEVQLFNETLRDNILLGRDSSEDKLKRLLEVCQLRELVERLPEGLNHMVSEGAGNLSGGERQRVGIARALAQDKPVLVLDEATTSLDPRTERKVVLGILERFTSLSLLYVTHKYSLLNHFGKIIVLNEGTIIEKGSFEKLIEQGGMFRDLYEASLMEGEDYFLAQGLASSEL